MTDWPTSGEMQLAWEHEGTWHAIVMTDIQPSSDPRFAGHGRADTTLCGVRVPPDSRGTLHAVTCDECLWGGIDGLLAERKPAGRMVPGELVPA